MNKNEIENARYIYANAFDFESKVICMEDGFNPMSGEPFGWQLFRMADELYIFVYSEGDSKVFYDIPDQEDLENLLDEFNLDEDRIERLLEMIDKSDW